MTLKIERAAATGFCFGVKRAIDILEKAAQEFGQVKALGDIVHNQQALQNLAKMGVNVVDNLDDIEDSTVAIGTHGVSPQLETEMKARFDNVINTTCPFVHRAQITARRMANSGFFVIIYGDVDHTEVKGILGWANNKGAATLDNDYVSELSDIPRRIGVLSQTTQIPARFTEFIRNIIDKAMVKDSELRITDTICHDIRERQQAALELAKKVDLVLVIGSHTSANTGNLAELCATITETHLIETAEDIRPKWLKNRKKVGVTGGASTSDQTIDEVIEFLKS